MIKKIPFITLLLIGSFQSLYAKPVDDVKVGAAFIDTCVRLAPDSAAIRNNITKGSQWIATPVPADLGLGKSANSSQLSTWRQNIDGHDILLVLIDDASGSKFKRTCAFVVRDERPAMWYFRSVSDQVKPFGMKLKQQDIPHWRSHKGKFADGTSGLMDMRSRSAALPGKDILHLVISY
jgi:hypothetical protein